MELLKKIISLHEAAQISGYTQDYLGYLIRNNEIKGVKKGRVWFTTEEEVKNYIFKKKIRSKKFAIRDFFSRKRSKNIFIINCIIFISVAFLLFYFNKKELSNVKGVTSATVSDGEALIILE